MQVNEKGQLRLSHRALLPDTDPEKASAQQPTGDPKDVVGSQETSDEGLPKKMISIRKGDLAEDISSPKSNTAENTLPPQKKFIRRLVSPAKDRPNINKDKTKKSSSEVVNSVSSNGENTLVNGEANIG